MRATRGFIILLVIAHPARSGTRTGSRRRARSTTRRNTTRCSASTPTRSTRSRSSRNPASGRRCSARDRTGTIVQPAPAPTDQATVSGITSNLASIEIQRVIDENPADLAEFGLATPRVEVAFKAGGQQHRLPDRAEDAGRHRRLRQARRSEAGLPGLVVSRVHLQQEHLRPARQVGAEGRSREGRFASTVTTAGREMRFEKSNGEWQLDAAGRRPRRVQRGRRARLAGWPACR